MVLTFGILWPRLQLRDFLDELVDRSEAVILAGISNVGDGIQYTKTGGDTLPDFPAGDLPIEFTMDLPLDRIHDVILDRLGNRTLATSCLNASQDVPAVILDPGSILLDHDQPLASLDSLVGGVSVVAPIAHPSSTNDVTVLGCTAVNDLVFVGSTAWADHGDPPEPWLVVMSASWDT